MDISKSAFEALVPFEEDSGFLENAQMCNLDARMGSSCPSGFSFNFVKLTYIDSLGAT